MASLVAGTYWCARLAYADHLSKSSTPADVAHAIQLAPANAGYWLRWADLMAAEGQHPADAAKEALARNPQDAEVWIRAGLQSESEGDFALAEQRLLRGAEVSSQYLPRWSLANFYFRRGNDREFWRWFPSALDWAYGDLRPLFVLGTEMSADPEHLLREALPSRPAVLESYLWFTMKAGDLGLAGLTAGRLAPMAGEANKPALLEYVTRAIDGSRPESALAVWNTMCARGLLPYAPLDPAAAALTNGGFEHEVLNAGFDWRLGASPGVATVTSQNPAYWRATLSGRQPEKCELISQIVPLSSDMRYRLEFEYETSGIRAGAGVRWKVFDVPSGGELRTEGPDLWDGGSGRAAAEFTAPAGRRHVRVVLGYDRSLGTTRAEGAVLLRSVRLRRAP